MITYYDSINNGYNILIGGNSHPLLSEETKDKISRNRKGKLKGENHWGYGKKRPPEVVEKMSKALKGKYCGDKAWWYGRTHSEETKKKIGQTTKDRNYGGGNNPCARPVLCIETNETFGCCRDAAKKYALPLNGVSRVARGERHSCGGYTFKYIDTDEKE